MLRDKTSLKFELWAGVFIAALQPDVLKRVDRRSESALSSRSVGTHGYHRNVPRAMDRVPEVSEDGRDTPSSEKKPYRGVDVAEGGACNEP